MTKLRLIEEADIQAVVDMGAEMFAGSSFAPLGYAPEKVADFVRRVADSGLAVVSVEGDEITGLMLGDVIAPWYSAHRMAVDHVLYVRPKYRGSRAALMLVKAWVRWALECGVTQIRPGVSTGDPRAEQLYAALGFQRVGSVFLMDVTEGQQRK